MGYKEQRTTLACCPVQAIVAEVRHMHWQQYSREPRDIFTSDHRWPAELR
jgi:hypothetical protein